MEKKDWKEELQDIINREMFKEDLMMQIKSLVEHELDKAREEGARDVFTKEELFTMEELAYLEEVMHLDYSLAVTFGQREKSDIGGGLLRKLDKLNKKK